MLFTIHERSWQQMLSVAIHKDIGEYEPKYFAKMGKRTIIFVCGAIGSCLVHHVRARLAAI